MKQITSNLIGVALAVVVTVTTGSAVLAQQSETEPRDTTVSNEQTRATREQRIQRVERSLDRCERIQTRLGERVTRSTEVKTTHTVRYERLMNRLDIVITGADSKGYDTAALIAAQSAVDATITAYGAAFDAYTTQLRATSDVTCQEDAAAYAESIVESRDALVAVRTAGAAVKSTFRQTVVPALQEYKTWLEENATTTEESTS